MALHPGLPLHGTHGMMTRTSPGNSGREQALHLQLTTGEEEVELAPPLTGEVEQALPLTGKVEQALPMTGEVVDQARPLRVGEEVELAPPQTAGTGGARTRGRQGGGAPRGRGKASTPSSS